VCSHLELDHGLRLTPELLGPKFNMLRNRSRSLLIGAAALLAAGLLFATRNTMTAMNCETLDAETFKATLAAENQEPMYTPPSSKTDTWSARFALTGFGATADGATLMLSSDLAGGLIYNGPFQTSLHVVASRRLLERRGLDGFRFVLVHHKARRICVAEHRAKFWQEGQLITVEHLPMRESDQDGLPVAFRVSARSQ
jgi:hypothetical protein